MDALSSILEGIEIDEDTDYMDEYGMEDEGIAIDGETVVRKRKSSRKGKSSSGEKETSRKENIALPAWVFTFPNREAFSVHLSAHDIKYKEQQWIINERDVEYYVEPVLSAVTARAVANTLGLEEAEKKKSETGEIRWLRLCTYEEAIPYGASVLGYVRLEEQGGKLKKVNYYSNRALAALAAKRERIVEKMNSAVGRYIKQMRRA